MAARNSAAEVSIRKSIYPERWRPKREPPPPERGKWFAGAIVVLLKRAETSVIPALRRYSAFDPTSLRAILP